MRGLCASLTVLVVLAFLAVPAAALEKFPLITKVSIRGNGDIREDDIRGVISEIVPRKVVFFWKQHPPLDPLVVERNVDILRQFLAGSGYHESSVVWRREDSRDGKTSHLKIDIELGSPTVVSHVNLDVKAEGFPPAHLSRLSAALAEIPVARGRRFSVRRFKKAKGVVKNTLLEMGYAAATVESRGEVNRSQRRADLTFTIVPGGVHTFGDIRIDVSDKTLRDVVIGAITYKTGEPSAPSKIIESKRRLVGLGYFESVFITPRVDHENLSVHTTVRAVGRKNRTFQISAGAGREDRVRGRMKFINRNFLNLNRTLELSARASFASQSASATIQQPGIIGPDSILSALFDIRREDYPSHEADFLIGSINLEKGFRRGLFTARFIPTVIDSTIIRAPADPSNIGNIFLVLLRGGFHLTRTDDPLDPARGFYIDMDWELSPGFLGSEREYLKSVFEVAGYYDFGGLLGGVVLAKRIQTGFIEAFGGTRGNDVPVFRRLFAGGENMRGFSFQTLGPLDKDTKDPLGGNSLLTGSVETRFPLPWLGFGGVVFFDYGNVSEHSFDYPLDDLRYAVGFGLRYKVSGIPIGLDFGYALNPDPRLRRYQFLFNIGQAF